MIMVIKRSFVDGGGDKRDVGAGVGGGVGAHDIAPVEGLCAFEHVRHGGTPAIYPDSAKR